jgi:hypothetical protein
MKGGERMMAKNFWHYRREPQSFEDYCHWPKLIKPIVSNFGLRSVNQRHTRFDCAQRDLPEDFY